MIVHIFGSKFKLIKRLKSKKNRVCLVRNGRDAYVLKLYRAPYHRRSCAEHRVLKEARRGGLAVPQPLAFIKNKALLMKWIPGENLCDALNRRCLPEYADQLAQWFSTFHGHFKRPGGRAMLRGDAILRNFIVHPDGTLYGIDFEEAKIGNPLEDLAKICASILDTDPMFTAPKVALCRRLLKGYGRITGKGNLESAAAGAIARALRETSQYRPEQRRYLLQKAVYIEQGGLEKGLASTGEKCDGRVGY